MAQALALAAVLAASGVVAGTASASGTRVTTAPTASASLTYRCRFPAGPRRVQVTVSAGLPAAVKAGKPIQPADVRMTVALPPRAIASLASLHSATVRAATWLTVSASEGPVGTSIVWPGATRRAVPVPAHGSLTLRTPGRVPSVTPAGRGQVVLTAAGLSMTLTPGKAVSTPRSTPNSSPSPGGPNRLPGVTSPGSSGPMLHALQVNCALTPGQHAVLATVTIAGGKAPRKRHAPTVGICPPDGKLKLNPRFPHPKPQKGAKRLNATPFPGCAWVGGYSDVRKLKGAALVGPVVSDITENLLVFFRPPNPKKHDHGYLQLDNALQLENHGKHEFPPSTATFLSFGFVPTSATMHIMEIGTINAFAVGTNDTCPTCVQTTTVNTRARIGIDNVRVNGVPLDVGSACETPQFNIIVSGSNMIKPPYNIQFGGPLFGMVDIPRFKNCGVGQNLDPIFNAAISGKRNFSLLTQGLLCSVSNANGCDPKTGKPVPPKLLIRKVSN